MLSPTSRCMIAGRMKAVTRASVPSGPVRQRLGAVLATRPGGRDRIADRIRFSLVELENIEAGMKRMSAGAGQIVCRAHIIVS